MRSYKLLEAWKSQPGAEYTLEEVLDVLCEYVKDDVSALTAAIESAQGLTQLPGTAFYVLPVEEGRGNKLKFVDELAAELAKVDGFEIEQLTTQWQMVYATTALKALAALDRMGKEVTP